MDDEILKIVMNTKGEGFNEKFERLVIEYHKSIPEREKYLQNLEQQIQSKLKILNEIENRINGLKSLDFNLDTLRRDILRIQQNASSIVIVSQQSNQGSGAAAENEIQKKKMKCIS